MPFLFFKLPPYDLIYDDPYAFQQLRLHFRIRLSSRGFKTEKVVGEVEGGLQEGEGHLIRLIPTHTSAAGAGGRAHRLPANVPRPHRHLGSSAFSKGSLKIWCPGTLRLAASALPVALAQTEEAAFLRVGWNESPRGGKMA